MSNEKIFRLDPFTVKCDHDRFMELINAALNECFYFVQEKDEEAFSDDHDPHTVAEAMCWKCGRRWIAAYPSSTLLKELECPGCHNAGHAFLTGQDIVEDD